MASKGKGPLYSLVVRGLVRVDEANVQVIFKRRPVLQEPDMARVSSDGNIIFHGAALRSVREFCEIAIGKKTKGLRSRVLIDGESLDELFERVSQPLPAPSTAPPDFERFRMFLAELIQARFSPEANGFVRGNELEMWEPDDRVAYFLRNLVPHTVHESAQHVGFPSGRFPCVKYKITDASQLLQLFGGTGIDFVFVKYFATAVDDPSRLDRIDVPLPLDTAESRNRSTRYLHWLILERPDRITRHHALHFTWWPSLLPSSRTGKLQVQFSYVCVGNGLIEPGSLPVQPTAAEGLELHLERYQVLPPAPTPTSLKIRIRRDGERYQTVPEEPPLKIRLRKF